MICNDSSSSFEPINELETLFLSTTSNSTISEKPLEDKNGEELSKLKLEYSRQKIEIELMKRERDSIKNEVKTNDSAFKTQLSGRWKIIDSSNLEQYLQKRRAAAPTTTDLDDVIFHVALKNISFSADQVMLHEHIGSMKYNEKVVVLNQPVINEKGAESGELTWISGNSMKTVSIGSDESESSEEYFVKDGHLHVITRGFGVICKRVYDRGSPLSSSTGNNTSNELLESLRNELKEMRMEMKEMKEDVKENKKRLEEIGENQRKLQEDVARKVPESYGETDIRRQISGKWRNVNDHNSYFSAKWEGDTFMEKRTGRDNYAKYTIGVRNNSGFTISVQNNEIVKRVYANHREEYRYEYFIENERLQRVDYSYGTVKMKYTFERIGDPDPE